MQSFFTKTPKADAPVASAWETIERERQEVETALAQNAIALAHCDSQSTLLQAEQRKLFARRNEIYLRRAELKGRGESNDVR
jgi:hypothetical protein